MGQPLARLSLEADFRQQYYLACAWDQRAPLPVAACQVHSPYGFAQTARAAYNRQ